MPNTPYEGFGGQAKQTINLRDWLTGNIDQRATWLAEGAELDGRSRQVLAWAQAFKDMGASISNEAMLRVYEGCEVTS